MTGALILFNLAFLPDLGYIPPPHTDFASAKP
jgi:hypothetical protein